MTGGTEVLSFSAALVGALTIWAAYGGAVRGWISTGRGAYIALSTVGAVLIMIGLGTSVGIGPTTALAASIAIALISAIRLVASRS